MPPTGRPLPFILPKEPAANEGGAVESEKSRQDDSDFMFEKQFVTHAAEQYADKDIFVDISDDNLPYSRWTKVSDDNQLMNHLLRMFWTWDNIVERTIYRPMFERDLVTMDPNLADNGCGSFCSRFLVNALLALSCLYTMNSKTFQDTGDPITRGRYWADEAEALLSTIEQDTVSFPLLQGLLAMFCYEGNLGLGTKALPYYFRAMDVYKGLNNVDITKQQLGVDEERTKQGRVASSWCIWGFYCCEWRGTQALGLRKLTRKPVFPKVWREPDFPLLLPTSSSHWWYPYPISLQVQKSLKVEIREVDALLSEVVEEALDFIYPDENEAPPSKNPQLALQFYRSIVNWKQNCPNQLRLEDAVLPSAILLHISAEVMLTAILRPFTNMNKAQFGKFDPRERCYAHASNLASAIWTYRSFAVIRFEYWLTHALGTAAHIVVGGTEDAPVQMDTLTRACQCLYEMRSTLPLATDILCGIRIALKQLKEKIPAFMDRFFDRIIHRKDGLMHHFVASLLPDSIDMTQNSSNQDIQLQELLNRLEDIGVD
ncbi:hypothetical protein FPRO06_11996 [Fusarium proliferatum]|nr:hypothetical protein FPRO06_11996 [Fusarium proliferatum]